MGKSSRKCFNKHIRVQEGIRKLRINASLLLPVKTEIEYLGVKLSWKRCSDSIVLHRIQRGRRAFAMLHQWWRMPLSLSLKVRLFSVMIIPVFCYGVNAGGLSDKASYMLRKELLRCLRRLAKSPAHITLESDERLLSRLNVVHPATRVQVACCQLLRRMLQTLRPEVCACGSLALMADRHAALQSPWWSSLRKGLQKLFPSAPEVMSFNDVRRLLLSASRTKIHISCVSSTTSLPKNILSPELFEYKCEGCGRYFFNYNRLRSHQYGSKCAWNKEEAEVHAHL